MSGPGAVAEHHRLIDQRLDPESAGGSRIPALATTRSSSKQTLVASGRPFTMLVTPWRRPAVARHDSFCLLQGVI
jgi:hypothetical protein